MTTTTPVERVAKALETAKFRRMPLPLQIAGLAFDVPAAFVGVPPSPDLVVVGDTTVQSARDLQRTVEGVGRALDVVRSRRPLTLIVVGPRPESKSITALSRYARVLPVGESADEASLGNWLAVLLPLSLPEPVEARGLDSLEQLRAGADPLTHELIDLARAGAPAVGARFAELVEEPFAQTDEPDMDDAP
ncbi:hypothetical protein J2X65_004890 [Ancylobacter sp. 3268]|uniref:hypothetical protein n=1 Tax=Ancylobacter sp. 3268 TaxID=2817752 RepID=UPI002857A1F1|nr:hypothetical protein [Ancylobacter sp. 3268]MDR6955510.1 hypothetical protein [Ancylobacter sp. 3268]